MNKTEMLLFIKYETPTIPLELTCEEYFGCGSAKIRAKAGVLPIPVFRLGT